MDQSTPKARREDLLLEELPTELLVYDQKSHRAHCLNASAAAVFRSADGSSTVAEIARAASARLGTPFDEDLAWLALQELDKNDLLETPLPPIQQGTTRRDFVVALGAASVLIPLVTAITAPTPAYAQSAGGSSTGPPGTQGGSSTGGF